MRQAVRTFAIMLGIAFACSAVPAAANAEALDFGGGCVLFTDNPAATVDALRFRCGPGQYDAIFHSVGPGAVPMGVKNGWVVSPPAWAAIAPPFWIGKHFYPGYVRNRLTGAGLEGVQGSVYIGSSYADGGPAWYIDYAGSVAFFVHDEIREVTPGVYLGFSHNVGGSRILTFVLA